MNEIKEVKSAIYAGMSIYKEMDEFDIILEDNIFLPNEKKYLSLYLGLLNTENGISELIQKENIKIPVKKLKIEDYLEIYKNSFVDILKEIDFESITHYFNYLLEQDIVKMFNEEYKIDVFKIDGVSNKQLVKK